MTGRILIPVSRILLGAAFLLFGLNGFMQFLPAPPPLPAQAMGFVEALMATGYLIPLVKGIEVIAGALLLLNRFVPLALTLLAPLLVNIVAFHVFLAPAGTLIPLVLLAAELYLAWSYRQVFAAMLARRAETKGASSMSPARPLDRRSLAH